MKIYSAFGLAVTLSILSAPAMASDEKKSQDWHKKSDMAKGADQITAPAKGKVYGNPDRQKALDDAFKAGQPSKPASSSKSATASPQ
ncbi:hypothetical protein [Parasphingorhabdus sp.]|uniref:hypothetical protein n=1 Tax=Parasphingorhabdus sp. TaxID=2709688 RepID=UPI003A91FDD3